jgi:DNA-directed RNA polymerase subunit RPC12/RpoP
MAIKLRDTYKCAGCGEVVSIEEALAPPTENKQAEPLPCKTCGKINWQPVKQRQ